MPEQMKPRALNASTSYLNSKDYSILGSILGSPCLGSEDACFPQLLFQGSFKPSVPRGCGLEDDGTMLRTLHNLLKMRIRIVAVRVIIIIVLIAVYTI